MLSTTKKKNRLKYILPGALAIVLLGAGASYYVYGLNGTLFGWTSRSKSSSGSYDTNPPTDEQRKAGEQTKKNTQSSSSSDSKTTGSDTPPAPTAQPGNNKKNVDITTTHTGKNGTTYQLRFQIDTPTDNGTCTLTLTQGSAVVIKTAGVQAQAKISTCKGFDIPTGELTSGIWRFTLKFENDSLIGNTSGNITI